MSLHSWLQNLRAALAPRGGRRHHQRRGSHQAAIYRPSFEVLEDRRVPAFVAPVDYAVAGDIGMQAGDFNGDGILDLATAGGRSVSVLLSNGDGTFQPARNTSTTESQIWQNALAVGDFNQDGKLDLASANVLLGRGDGTFVNGVPLGGASSIVTGDMNGDGTLDLVVARDDPFNGTTYVDVLRGQYDGTFSPTSYHVDGPAESYSLALADFDGDNQLDLVLGGYFTTWVLLRNGDGSFQAPRDLGLVAQSLTVADFNADGKPDLATTSGGSVSVLLGNGDGSFQTARSFSAAGGSVAAADVNGDRALDLVLGSGNVLLGTGDGNFGPPITTAATGGYLVVADFNGDGRPDAALPHSRSVTVLFNDGIWDGSPPPPPPPTLRLGDVTVTEGNVGTASATFTVTLSAASTETITVAYATGDGTATGSDYQAASGMLTFAPDETVKTVTVLVNCDRVAEPDETFAVNLTGASNATISDGQGIGTIVDDEPRISITDVTKKEGKKNQTTQFTFTVTLSAAYDQAVTLSYQTVNGTATTGDGDYVAQTGTITFKPGERTKTITIEVKGDSKKEADETFYLDLLGLGSNALFTKKRGTGTILNDD